MHYQTCLNFLEISWTSRSPQSLRIFFPYNKLVSAQVSMQNIVFKLWLKNSEKHWIGGDYAALLTDLSKAFDCTPYDLIIAKLNVSGFDIPSLKLVNSYLTNRHQKTKIHKLQFLETYKIRHPTRINFRSCIIQYIFIWFVFYNWRCWTLEVTLMAILHTHQKFSNKVLEKPECTYKQMSFGLKLWYEH